MKKNIILILGILLMISRVSFAQTGIAGTGHDFSGETWNTTTDKEICKICHTPHKADISVTNAPLWNHALTQTSSYQLYTSATMDATTGQPDESSKLCLSCHDGTVALENYGTVTTGTTTITGDALIGTDLRDDHPISFTYDDNLATADGRLYAPSTTNSGLGAKIADDLLINGKMQCASCHDVHNRLGNSHLLKKSNAGSALCVTCHNK